MNLQSIGDIAQSFAQLRQSTNLKQQMNRLSQELVSGRAADLTSHLSGSFGHLADVEHELRILESHRSAASEARFDSEAMQAALESVQTLSGDLGAIAVTAGTTTGAVNLSVVSSQARGGLDAIVSALNTDVAGRSLFAGADVIGAPLASADELLNEVRTALSSVSSVADTLTALDAFFDTPGGGFESVIYQGGTTPLAAYQLGEGESVSLDLRADDPALRGVLKQVVLAALVNDDTLSLTPTDRDNLARLAGEGLLTGQDRLTGLRADLGFAEGRIDRSATRIAAGITSLEIARNDLVSVDIFETAGELENVQFQLETLYTLTARTSRLNLMNFLS